jgi:spermidine/putrescine transport system substrate-binding protein
VWFDGWVIPKYAQNTKAASYWINFMSRPDIVIRNVDVTGYVSVSGAPEVMEAFVDEELDPIDVSYFFGPQATAVRLDPVLYPDKETIARSTMEHDWGEHTADLVAMWNGVKGNNMNWTTIIILCIAAVALIALIVSRIKRSQSRRSNRYSGKNARRRR